MTYQQCLIADLQNDRIPDVLVLGNGGTKAFRLATNAPVADVSLFSRLKLVGAKAGALLDLDFTGKLDLLAINSTNPSLQVFRNLGSMYYMEATATSGVPAANQAIWGLVVFLR